MSREEVFFDAITNLPEALVEEAQRHVFRRRAAGGRYTRLAACLALAALLGLGAYQLRHTATGGGDYNTAMPPSGDCGAAPDNSSSAPQDAPGDGAAESGGAGEPEAGDLLRFTAPVLEVREGFLVVSTEEYGPVEVPTAGLEDLPEVREGGVVAVLCREISLEDGAARAAGVTEIRLVEPEDGP